jgi:hypothetical protein
MILKCSALKMEAICSSETLVSTTIYNPQEQPDEETSVTYFARPYKEKPTDTFN